MTTGDPPVVFQPADDMQAGFLATGADIAIFGGKAGTGKTGAALIAVGQHVDLPGYGGVIFRRVTPELFGAQSVWAQSRKFYPALEGVPVRSPHAKWTFPSDASVEFLGLQYEGDEESHQGKRYTCVLFEEVTQFTAAQFWFLFGRIDDLRATSDDPQGRWKRGDVLCKGHLRATCNPDASSFVRELIDWWIGPDGYAIEERAGVLRWFVRRPNADGSDKETLDWFASREEAKAAWPNMKAWSLTFFPGKPSPHMGADYEDRLNTLSYVKRERMAKGNWNIREEAGTILKREWFPVVDQMPALAMRTVRGWDKGAVSGGDATEGAKVCSLGPGQGWVIMDFVSSRGTSGERKAKTLKTAEDDGPSVLQCIWQDPGSAGVYEAEQAQADIRAKGRHCTIEPATKSKLVYAEAWATKADLGHRGEGPRVYVLRGPWNDAFFAELDSFDGKDGRVDNKIDAVSRAFLELDKGAKDAGASVFTPKFTPRGGLH